MTRRNFLEATLATAVLGICDHPALAGEAAPEFKFDPAKPLISAPKDSRLWPEFRRQLASWREAARRELSYSDAFYRRADFAWVARDFSCCFLMLCDQAFYDPRDGHYTVAKFLEQSRGDFGGFDSIVLWHAYPRIGLDERNQFDFYRDMPGGLNGLRAVSRQLRRAGVKVFIDYNPWDTGTRREGKSDVDSLCDLVAAIEADGIFLDTMDKGAVEFRGKLDAIRQGVVLEGEIALPLDRVQDHHLSWAQWFADSEVPGVLRNKWFERRHLQHQIKRWDTDHTGELHAAWMNGSGIMVWENVFGSWVGWSLRDRSILRAMLPIQRRFSDVFSGERWTPLVPTLAAGVYASLWEGDGLRLWTLVNRSEAGVEGPLIDVKLNPGEKLFDLVYGEEVKAAAGRIAPRGIGCFLAAELAVLKRDFGRFLEHQKSLSARGSSDSASPRLNTTFLPPAPSRIHSVVPENMAEIPRTGELTLRIEVRERECGFYESSPPGGHRLASSYEFRLANFERKPRISRFAMDMTPVTNAQFLSFLQSSRYTPKHRENFLKHWNAGAPPRGKEEHPVVYVDLGDARAYARWAGKRLPTEEEWQYAAQGPQALKYPWGNEMLGSRCNGGETGGTTPVRAFPDGRSPFGIYDLCGNVWEWTESERSDGRTRFCMIRGGSYYSAKGSGWYMDGGPRSCSYSQKCLMMWPGLDRCATVGFRCVADLA